MNRLEKAIEDFSNDESTEGLGARIEEIRNAIMWQNLDYMKRSVKGKPVSEEDQEKLDNIQKWFSGIEKLYANGRKMSKLKGESINKMDIDFLDEIKKMKNAAGEVVRQTGDNGVEE